MRAKRTTGLRSAANDYVTIVAQASAKVKGFKQLYKEMERAISEVEKAKVPLPTMAANSLTWHFITIAFQLNWIQNPKVHVQQPSSSSRRSKNCSAMQPSRRRGFT